MYWITLLFHPDHWLPYSPSENCKWLLSGECMLLSSVSSQQRFGATDFKALSTSQPSGLGQIVQAIDKPSIALRQISVTALFYLEVSRRIHPRSVKACQPKDAKSREWRSVPARCCGGWRRKHFGSSFCMFVPLPGPALCKLGLARRAVCSTRGLHSGLGPSFALFSRDFPFLVF